ncbi:MAG TPA: inorganic diphosphatase [Vicinamibacterales bacterium]|nr:inorganic diphosphatase [Vicinamibacterales bacterium]
MHPWHDVPVDESAIDDHFPAIIEVPLGSTNKLELDKASGSSRLDRVLHSAVYYPPNYGFAPRTYRSEGDPLDVLVFGRDPIHPLTIVEIRAIGVMKMRDDKGLDDKLLAVNIGDPAFSDYRDFRELPKHVIREMSRFFQAYRSWKVRRSSSRNRSDRPKPLT